VIAMPIITRKPPEPSGREDLEARLVAELNSPGDKGQPLILHNPIAGTKAFNVYVIWDRWAGVESWLRQQIIYDAYHNCGYDPVTNIPVASGLTTNEAILDGLLPARIDPIPQGESTHSAEELRGAMMEEGAVEAMGRLQLRFPTLEDGQAAFERLQARYPGCFRFVEEVPLPTD